MPWFPEFVSAVELARRQTRAAGLADPVGRYVAALNKGDIRALERVWPGEVVVHDPRHGEIRGHRQLRQFVKQSRSWLAERDNRVETVASTVAGGRAVVELLAHLAYDGRELAWPAVMTCRRRRGSGSTSVARAAGWPQPASTTTLNRPTGSSVPEPD